ncbi:F-box domain containing protein [Tanacetum coccineum]
MDSTSQSGIPAGKEVDNRLSDGRDKPLLVALLEGSKNNMDENTIDTTDRISMLPDSVVHHILSYLRDDPKSHVRKYDNENIMDTFCKYVEYTVSRFCEQNISAQTLIISAEIINSEEIEFFKRCVDLVTEKGLQMMDIRLDSPPNLPKFHLPNTFLSASSLTYLRLHKCELPSSLMVGVVKLKSLRLLTPSCLRLDEGVIEYLTKALFLKKFISEVAMASKHIEAPNLSYFSLISHKDKAPSMFLDSCKKLTTFCCRGFPLTRFNDFLSNFQFLENVALYLTSHDVRKFWENSIFKVLGMLAVCRIGKLTNVKKLKLIQSPSYKLEHVKLKSRSVIRKSRVYIALLDVLLWCFRPQSLPLELGDSINKRGVVEFTYEKLLQQEGEGQTCELCCADL